MDGDGLRRTIRTGTSHPWTDLRRHGSPGRGRRREGPLRQGRPRAQLSPSGTAWGVLSPEPALEAPETLGRDFERLPVLASRRGCARRWTRGNPAPAWSLGARRARRVPSRAGRGLAQTWLAGVGSLPQARLRRPLRSSLRQLTTLPLGAFGRRPEDEPAAFQPTPRPWPFWSLSIVPETDLSFAILRAFVPLREDFALSASSAPSTSTAA